MPSGFNDLLDIECSCLLAQIEKCAENTEATFCRKIDKKSIKIKDFKSRWERNKKTINGTEVAEDDCAGILSLKGISIDLYSDENKEKVLEKYRTTFAINQRKVKYAIFQLRDGAGRVKHSPHNGDNTHHDFYKSDEFTLDHIMLIETRNIIGGSNEG